jgi:two-component system, chemotaxis family, chemotaxis protein CheY
MARILIADNASFMRSCLKYIVENAGHEVVGMAKEGREAVHLHEQLKPDLVTLDILMEEGMDGIAALGTIIKDHPSAKVIMVTAMGQDQVQEEARKLGAVGYIRKPFKPTEIVHELERVLGSAVVKT